MQGGEGWDRGLASNGSAAEGPRFVGVEDVAVIFGVHAATVRRWVALGELPRPYRFGGTLRWELRELLAEIRRKRPTA